MMKTDPVKAIDSFNLELAYYCSLQKNLTSASDSFYSTNYFLNYNIIIFMLDFSL